MPDREEGLLGSRQTKLDRLRQRGVDPYPPRFHRTCDAATAIARFEAGERNPSPGGERQELALAGRIVSVRVMGRAAFLDLRDHSGTVQALLRQNALGDGYELLKDLDLGDFLGVTGPMLRTRTGQVSIEAQRLTLLAKGMRPLPEKFHGLRDVETRYRQRYLDLIANPELITTFQQRSRIISSIRRFLDGRGFLEVDTPVLVPVAAGAHARPFVTHHHALDQRLYLRIATELYLKRLIVGGFDKVYELGRVFRNEGMGNRWNPEFTMLELYQAYADYGDMQRLTEELVSHLALEILGTTVVQWDGKDVDLAAPWRRATMSDLIEEAIGARVDVRTDLGQMR
ncbi:MAG TPA: amino acid--tRNA ligase-related protein, partial [Dehalococcoidia bacterium]|nr:amino acid--tRNA ligase-related protein [Dehalococcoidia bacterium]